MNPEQITKQVHNKGEQLIQKGHICVTYLESYPPQLSWCHNTIKCEELTLREQTKEEKEEIIKKRKIKESIEAFTENLKKQGHKCISHIDTSPYVEWCQHKTCAY